MSQEERFTLLEVNNTKTKAEFHNLPVRLYRNTPNWSRPIDADVEEVFNPRKNKKLQKGEAIRWILQDSDGETVGRMAAFYDTDSCNDHQQPTGGIGFFDCIDDKEAAFKLFDSGKAWLETRGMEAMDGPVNLGMRDAFWGCLKDGFHEPVYNMPYNFPYYNDLFEAYGFKNYINQYTYQRALAPLDRGLMHPVIRRQAERIMKNPDYEFRMIEKGNKRFAKDFKTIYNKAWAEFSGVEEVSDNGAMKLLDMMEPIMDERLIYYGYYKGEPISFFIMMPDIGQITRKLNGKWNWWSKVKFLYNLKVTKSVDRVIGRIFGVIPEHQGRGVEGAMVLAFENEVAKPTFTYKSLELNWIGDFNPVMMKVSEFIGGKIYKTHVTYRYLFDRKKEFERAPKVNMAKK